MGIKCIIVTQDFKLKYIKITDIFTLKNSICLKSINKNFITLIFNKKIKTHIALPNLIPFLLAK